ncbi:MAG: hypothetical protein BalsKO_13190 [Balneolaceae bacterium]
MICKIKLFINSLIRIILRSTAMKLLVLLLFIISCGSTSAIESENECDENPIFLEKNGIVMVEAENVTISEGWELETDVEGYSGEGYLTWTPATNVQPNGQGLLAYTFKITNQGIYKVKIRNYHPCEDFTECNDIFLKMNDTEWRKNFNHTLAEWDWNSRQDVDHVFSDASYELEEGVHTLYLSGRSQDFSIDKIAIFHEASTENGYKTAELSTCSKEN